MDLGSTRAQHDSSAPQGQPGIITRILLPEIILALVYLLSAAAAIYSTRVGDVALLWPSNAIAAAVLIRLRNVRWLLATAGLLAACILANRIMGGSWSVSVVLTLGNLVEVAAMVYVFRRLIRFPYPDLTISQASIMTLVMGILITGGAALLVGAMLHLLHGADLWVNVRNWWATDALGACVLVPPIVLFSRANLMRLARPEHLRANLLTIPVCMLVTYVAIRHFRYPFVLVALAPMFAAFQVGAFGTSILSAFNCALVVVLWMFGIRPLGVEVAAGSVLDGLPYVALIAITLPPIAVGLATDARRRVTTTLRSSERRFRESMENSPLGVIMLDPAGRWTYSNSAMQEMLGYSQSELGDMDIGLLAHPDEIEDIRVHWNQLLKGEIGFYKVNRRFRRSDGSWLWVHCAVSLTRDDNDLPMHFIAQVESLEERRHAETRLAKEREFLRITLDSITDAVVTADAEGRINYMNHAAEGLIGRSLASTGRKHLRDAVPLTQADGSVPVADIIECCFAARRFVKRDEPCSLQRPDGSVRYVQDAATPVVDSDGALSGFVVVLQDVTQSVQRTRELRHRADHDALTGLLNRAAFERAVHKSFTLSRTMAIPSSLLVVDLDRFKQVNDTAGHAAGDAVLRHVAAVMRRSVRPTDMAGRLGGDEFALLLTDCAPERAREIAARVCVALNPLVTSVANVEHVTGASMGLAHCQADHADPGDWLKAADQACYAAKHAGRGRLQVWDPAQPAGAAPKA